MRVLDREAIVPGAAVAIALTLPAALVSQAVMDEGESDSLSFLFLLLVAFGFGLGGAVAARRAPGGPLANGAIAALSAFAVIQAIGLLRRLVAGDDVSLPSIAFAALLAYSCGLLGALVASRTGGADGMSGTA